MSVKEFPKDIELTNGIVFTQSQKAYNYEPKKDITAYELALIVPLFTTDYPYVYSLIETLPPEARRHFRELGK